MSAKHQLTEYGYLSSRLLCSKLSDLCVDKVGVQTGPFGSQLHKEDYVDIGTPIITVEHLGNNRISHIDTPFVTDEDKKRLSKYQLKSGDIVFSRVGSVDRRALVRKEEDGWLFSGRCLRVRVDKTKIDPVYLSYFFGLESFKKYIRSIAVGATMPSINTKILSDIPIYYPECLEEQKRIAHIFITNDEKVNINNQTNQTLEEMAQAIFKSWFVDFDPVKAKMNGEQPEGMDAATASLFPEKFVESELGLIPEGWEVGALSSVVDVIMGQSPKGSTYNDQNEGTPLVNGPVEFGVYHPVAQKWTTAPTKMSKNKDLIVCVRGSTTGRYVVSDGEYCLGRGVCSIRSNDFPSFANYLFKSELNSLLHLTTGSTFPSWSGPTLKNFKVVVPSETIIEKFELLIGKLCEMMARNTGQNETLSTLRDTLLPKLLSGEIELAEISKTIK